MFLTIAGDFVPNLRILPFVERQDVSFVDEALLHVIRESDYAIVNLEAPIVLPNDGAQPIDKTGPNLSVPQQTIPTIKKMGFNAVTLANNHFYDYGDVGVHNTLQACKEHTIDVVGGGLNAVEASSVLYKKIGNETLGVINVCESEFTIASTTTAGANPLNLVEQFYQISEAKKHADYVVIVVHGGVEMYQLPTPRMQQTYRFFVDCGADAVVNHHQHCFSGYEVYKSKPIVYGLGNFCFDGTSYGMDIWNEGYLVTLNLSKKKITLENTPYIQNREQVGLQLQKRAIFDRKLTELNTIIQDESILHQKFEELSNLSAKTFEHFFEPIQNKYFFALQSRKWLPIFFNREKRKRLLNYIRCESHRDVLLSVLQAEYKKIACCKQ